MEKCVLNLAFHDKCRLDIQKGRGCPVDSEETGRTCTLHAVGVIP